MESNASDDANSSLKSFESAENAEEQEVETKQEEFAVKDLPEDDGNFSLANRMWDFIAIPLKIYHKSRFSKH
jgi:hypothetical protein